MDMINGFNDSKKEDISKRLMQNFRGQNSNPNIMDEAIKWIKQNYGLSKIDRIKEGAKILQMIKRREDEDMANFIIRFEAGMDKLKAVNMILSQTVEVEILQRAASLTKTEENNLLPMVKVTSTDPNLTLNMKEALRNIGFRKDPTKKEERGCGPPTIKW